jgi:methionyl aminopeptidase
LRPVYPLSEKRQIPKSIPHPEWSESGMPNYPYVKRNNVAILDQKGIAAMRKVCRLSREVLDIAAAAIKPGVTTDYIDEIVHQACIERKVSSLLQIWTWLILPGVSLSAELQPLP